jgi:prepilin-type processing-associated H-X9-DG protein
MSPRKRQPASPSFTLVELLVVIGIIALIASMLLPALTRSKQQARKAACVGNLRQVGIALSLYVEEQGFFPLATTGNGLGSCHRALRPVLRHQVLACAQQLRTSDKLLLYFPTNTYLNPPYGYNFIGSVWGARPPSNPGLGGDYVMNDSGGSYVPTPEGRVLVPAQMIALGDSPAALPPIGIPTPSGGPPDLLWISYPYVFPGAGVPGVGSWHNGGANLVFCDAHVQFAKQSVWIANSDEAKRLWNSDHQPR